MNTGSTDRPPDRPETLPARTGWWLALAFFGLTLGYSVVVHLVNGVYPYDDGYIIYRYVDNLFAGNGLVYNAGQRVFGVSTPLYLLWLILLKTFARPVATPDLAVRMNFVFQVAGGVGLLFLLKRLLRSGWLAALLAGLLVLRGGLACSSTGGMESFMFIAFVFWTLWALADDRFVLSGTLAGLSVLVRPEGLFLAGIVLLAWLVAGRRRPLPFLAGLLVPGLIWLVFGFVYYGTPVYQSITAKSAPLYPLPPGTAIRAVWRSVMDWTTAGLMKRSVPVTLVLLAIAGAGYYLRRRPGGRAWPVPALLGALGIFYLFANPMMFLWYYPPLESLWFASFAIGTVWLADRFGRRAKWTRPVILLLVLFLLGYPALKPIIQRISSGKTPVNLELEQDKIRTRTQVYRETAEWLNTVVPEGTVVASPEIGSLGFYYDKGPILDACGLVSPEAVPFLPVPLEERFSSKSGAISVDMVREFMPEVVVTLVTFAIRSLYDSDWFARTYVQVQEFPLRFEVWGSRTVDVFIRRDLVRSGGPETERTP